MLGIGEYLVTFPGPGDALYNNAHPELAEDFKENEGAETIQRDFRRRVFGFRAEPAPLEPEGGVWEVP